MQLPPSPLRTLEFPIGDNTYVVPPAGITAGMRLAEVMTAPDERAKTKLSSVALFKLALGPVWDVMQDDGVPFTEAWRVGMACLAREQVLLQDSGPERWDKADRAAQAIWESGIDPEAVAAWTAANTQAAGGSATKPSTPTGGASTTRRRASGTGTKNPKPRKPASRSAGNSSATRGR